jgi:hypothetical protein
MQSNLKLEARSWDPGWKCFDLATDPDELHFLGADRCSGLIDAATRTYGRLPGQGIARKN